MVYRIFDENIPNYIIFIAHKQKITRIRVILILNKSH